MAEKSIVQISSEGNVGVVVITAPNLGSREAQVIKQDVIAYAPKVNHRIVLDFAHVTMMGSLALGLLVELSKQCKATGGVMALCNLNEDLRGILKMSHLDRLLTITKDRASAIRKVS